MGATKNKGGPAPLCFLSDPKLFRLVLKSRIFSLTADLIFQFFVGEAWGERRIIFWKFKESRNFVFSVIVYVFSQNQHQRRHRRQKCLLGG